MAWQIKERQSRSAGRRCPVRAVSRAAAGANSHASAPAARQRGVALIIGLVILVVLALLGVSAYSVATQDERIAGNARDHARAMDAAETMLRACEHYIVQNPLVFDNGVQGFLPSPVNHTWFALDTVNNPTPWASGNTVALSKVFTWPNGAAAPDWMATPPQCIAEAVPVCQINCSKTAGALYEAHVAAQGYGLNTSTVVTLESYVAFYK